MSLAQQLLNPLFSGGYNQKVLGHNPIAYWPQSELSGSVARCLVNSAQNGTYTGVTLANDTTGPFGTPAPFYDGVNDYNNIQTAALTAIFNAAEGTLMSWVRVTNVGVWTDGTERGVCMFHADANNRVIFIKGAPNNQIAWFYRSQGTTKLEATVAMTATDWFQLTMTWSETDNLISYYLDGAPFGTPDANAQTWAGALNNSIIGAYTTIPTAPFHGWLGPVALWDRALPAAAVKGLYVD